MRSWAQSKQMWTANACESLVITIKCSNSEGYELDSQNVISAVMKLEEENNGILDFYTFLWLSFCVKKSNFRFTFINWMHSFEANYFVK